MRLTEMRFGDFAIIQPSVKLEKGIQYPYISMENIEPKTKSVSPGQRRIWHGSGGAKFENGDVLFARITPCLEHGKTAKVSDLSSSCGFGSTEFFVFRNRQEISDKDYIYYLSCSPIIREPAIKSMIGTSGRQRAQKTVIENIIIRVPDLTEQKRIGKFLSIFDDLVENNRRRITLLEKMAKMIYREWFVYLHFPGHERVKITDGIPERWKKGQVSDLGKVITGKTPSTKDDANYNGNIPFIKTPDMHNQTVVVETKQTLSERGANTQQKKAIPKGSVIVSCIGTVGVVSITSCQCHTNQQINSVVLKNPTSNYYAYFALSDLRPRLEAMGGGATMGNVNKTKFSRLSVIIPDKKILDRFHDTVKANFLQIENLLRYNNALSRIRDLFLPQLMNGEITI